MFYFQINQMAVWKLGMLATQPIKVTGIVPVTQSVIASQLLHAT